MLTQEGNVIGTLVHAAPVNVCSFCTLANFDHLLLSCGDDRSISLWDLRTQDVVHNSGVISPCPLLSMYVSADGNPMVITGNAEGGIFVHALDGLPSCRFTFNLIKRIETMSMIEKSGSNDLKKLPASTLSIYNITVPEPLHVLPRKHDDDAVSSKPIIFTPTTVATPVMKTKFYLHTPAFLIELDAQTLEISSWSMVVDLTRTLKGATEMIFYSALLCTSNSSLVICQFVNETIRFISIEDILPSTSGALENGTDIELAIPIFPTKPLPACSILRGSAASETANSNSVRKNNSASEKPPPATFHRNIRSSGYGSVKPRKLFGRDSSKPAKSETNKTKSVPPVLRHFPIDATPVQTEDVALNKLFRFSNLHSAGIRRLQWSSSGNTIATASWDGCVATVRVPSSMLYREKSTDKQELQINKMELFARDCLQVDWSFHSYQGASAVQLSQRKASYVAAKKQMSRGIEAPVLLASSPNTVKICSPARREELFSIPIDEFATSSFSIAGSQFFYEDKVILVCRHSSLMSFHYSMSPSEDCTQRYFLNGKLDIPDGCVASAATGINSPRSTTFFVATTSRAIHAFDLGENKVLKTWEYAHNTIPHALAVPDSSYAANLEAAHFNILASASITGSVHSKEGINVWDLRSANKCLSLYGHQHKSASVGCGIQFSPDIRYLAAGSEDNVSISCCCVNSYRF